MAGQRVLIIDDEEGVRTSLSLILEDEGYRVQSAEDPERGLELAGSHGFDVVLCDVRMPKRSGLEILPELIQLQPDAAVLMMSAYGDTEQALDAVRQGAYDYLAKPFRAAELLLTLRKAEERERLRRENQRLRRELSDGRGRGIIAVSEAMQSACELIDRAADYKTVVLITGESGVGKEVVARSIHDLGPRAAEPFVAVNCGAIPESLIESELFGHARGAFTGADSERAGLFRDAEGGTLFLDEIGELPPAIQVKLLRVLQENEVRPVGETKAIPVDVRIVAATARDLEAEIQVGGFREDLYYRLNVLRIHIPPLRERKEDVPALALILLSDLATRMGKPIPDPSSEVMQALQAYDWPGNVRELENLLERALILADGPELSLQLLPLATSAASSDGDSPQTDTELSIKRQTRLLERRLIEQALARTGGNRTQAARILEISPRALQYKIKEYEIEPLNPLARSADID